MWDQERGDALFELWVRRLLFPVPWLLVAPVLVWLATGKPFWLHLVGWSGLVWGLVALPFLVPQLWGQLRARLVLTSRRARRAVTANLAPQPEGRGVDDVNRAYLTRRDQELAGKPLRTRTDDLEWAEVRQQLQAYGLRSVVDGWSPPQPGTPPGPAPGGEGTAAVASPASAGPAVRGFFGPLAAGPVAALPGVLGWFRARWGQVGLWVVVLGLGLGLHARAELRGAERDRAVTERDQARRETQEATAANQTLAARLTQAEAAHTALTTALAERDRQSVQRVQTDAGQLARDTARRTRRQTQEQTRDQNRRSADQAGAGEPDPGLDSSLRDLAAPAAAGDQPAVPGVPAPSPPAGAPGGVPDRP